MPTIATATDTQTYNPPSLKPAISPSVELSLTIVYTILYGFLFLVVYFQLWMSLCFKHKRFSYQSVFLFLCLLWAGLRTTLFSFYFKNAVTANNLDTFLYWLLYCCPVCLQFITLCLLVVFFTQVLFKARGRLVARKYNLLVWLAVSVGTLIFLITNVTCAIIVKMNDAKSNSPPISVPTVRVVLNDSLFIVFGICLSVCLYRIGKSQSTNHVLEAKGLTVKQSIVMGAFIVLLYISRALYNMVALIQPWSKMVSFGYGWINVTDQADYSDLEQASAYVSFGIVLFVWELLPTAIVVVFFRVQKPRNSREAIPSLTSGGGQSRAYFFDNPRRYDSEDDLTVNSFESNRGSSGVFESSSPYSINHAASTGPVQHQRGMVGGTPPRIIQPDSQGTDYYDGT